MTDLDEQFDEDHPQVPPAGEDMAANVLAVGELVMLVDTKNRRYVFRLEDDGDFQTHAGRLPHQELVGTAEGAQVSTTRGQRFRLYRPTLSDFIVAMPRGAQVIYPKDIGAMLLMADIGPGMSVFETGIGSGALSMAMLRTGAVIHGLELREDFAARAQKNVETFLGSRADGRYLVELGDSYDAASYCGHCRGPFDRAVLDLPEPWEAIPHVATRMKQGAILVSYSPSVMQVSKVHQALDRNGFGDTSTTEVLHRGWHVAGEAVRPEHRMVGHTGFLTRARLLAE